MTTEAAMTTNIQETLDHLRELDRVTAPAPWVETINEENPDIPCLLLDYNGGLVAEGETDWEGFWPNLDNTVGLLTELRNALPVLLNEIDRLSAENKNLAEAWEDGYKTAANLYYDDISELDEFAEEARLNSPYRKEK